MSTPTPTDLPPLPADLPPAPDSSAESDPIPLTVLPGDDLTRFILRNPPPTNSSSSSRKNKKSRQNQSASAETNHRDDDDAAKLPPKIGTGLICTRMRGKKAGDGVSNMTIRIQAIVAGRLLYRPSSRTWYIASNARRYHLTQSPMSSTSLAKSTNGIVAKTGVGDRVIGIVEDQKASAEYYRVNIFGSHSALLHILSFEGATKRNRPYLDPGCLIYCLVVKGFGGGRMDPEVSCKVGGSSNKSTGKYTGKSTFNEVDDDGGAARKDWMTNEGTYGPLTGGLSFRISLGLARELLLPNNTVLSALDKSGLPFEIAVGVNGMAWVNSPEPEITIMIMNAIKNSEAMTKEQIRGAVKVMARNVRSKLDE